MQQTEKYWNLINRVALGVLLVMVILGIAMAFIPKINSTAPTLKKAKIYKKKLTKLSLLNRN